MDDKVEAYLLGLLERELDAANAELERYGYFDDPELITDLVVDEGPRICQIIAAFRLGQCYSTHRLVGKLVNELSSERPFLWAIAQEEFAKENAHLKAEFDKAQSAKADKRLGIDMDDPKVQRWIHGDGE